MKHRTIPMLITIGLLSLAACARSTPQGENGSTPGAPLSHRAGTTQTGVASSDFWIDPTEVSNQQYAACVAAGACAEPLEMTFYEDPAFAEHQVVYVTQEMAQEYCAWRQARLPRLGEWQMAAGKSYEKAVTLEGDYTPVCRTAGFNGAAYQAGAFWSVPETSPVGSGSPNPNGLYGLEDTIWEWVQESPGEAQAAAPVSEYISFVRISRFSGYGPLYQRYYCSFRCAGSQ